MGNHAPSHRRNEPHTIVACSTLSFVSDFPSHFHTRFEAVAPALQRTGLGRILSHCVALWSRFPLPNDPLVLDGVIRSGGDCCLVSALDRPDPEDEEKGGIDASSTGPRTGSRDPDLCS